MPENAPATDLDSKKYIQKVVGELLYYGRAVDSTILHSLSDLATEAPKSTTTTLNSTNHLLDYMDTHSDAILLFHRNGMILIMHSDASYLTASKSRS